MTRSRAGFVIVYRNRPGYMGLDTFLLVTGAGEAVTNAFNLRTCTRFVEYASAREWLKLYATSGDPSKLPGEIREAFEETRLVLADTPHQDDFLGILRNVQVAAPILDPTEQVSG